MTLNGSPSLKKCGLQLTALNEEGNTQPERTLPPGRCPIQLTLFRLFREYVIKNIPGTWFVSHYTGII